MSEEQAKPTNANDGKQTPCLLWVLGTTTVGLGIALAWSFLSSSPESYCGDGTKFVDGQCLISDVAAEAELQAAAEDCLVSATDADEQVTCICDVYGYGTRGPKFTIYPDDCGKYVSCFDPVDGTKESKLVSCEPGYAYDETGQVCFFKVSVLLGHVSRTTSIN